MVDDKAQGHVIEVVASGFIFLTAITIAITSFSVTPVGIQETGIGSDQVKSTDDLVDQLEKNGSLKDALLNWSETEGFNNGSSDRYYSDPSSVNDSFAKVLESEVLNDGFLYNIDVICSGSRFRYINVGASPGEFYTVSDYVILEDDDRVRTGDKLENVNYICPDESSNTKLYNVVEVEIKVWIP